MPITAPKKTWGGQWFPLGSFFVATFVTGGQESASKAPRFLAANRCVQFELSLTSSFSAKVSLPCFLCFDSFCYR